MTAEKVKLVVTVLFVLAVICFAIYYGSMKWLKVKEVLISSDKTPDGIDGLRILHISDLHGNSTSKMNLDIWSAIDDLKFDIAVITGDMTVKDYECLTPHLYSLEKLAARVPTYFVDGNHDMRYYDKMTELFDTYGIVTLNNEMIELYDGELRIIGYRDYDYLERMGKVEESANVLPDDGKFTIALYHEPHFYDELIVKPNISICGHTHGGQLRLPFFPTLYAPGQGFFPKYGDGLYDFNSNMMYISRGIGTTVFPIRFFNRPEIAVLTIKKQ